MVSEKVIIVLITLAIILSIISVAVTIASLNTPDMTPPTPKVNIIKVPVGGPAHDQAAVGVAVLAPPKSP